jgi:hypothetical protein
MKTLLAASLAALIMMLGGCASTVQPSYTASVDFVSRGAPGTIIVRSSGFGKDAGTAGANAEINAFSVLLFKGLPGTELNVPLVENESAARAANPDYFARFFDQGEYRKFMMSSTSSSNPVNVSGGVAVELRIKINYNSLRKDLEDNQVIRKFGF